MLVIIYLVLVFVHLTCYDIYISYNFYSAEVVLFLDTFAPEGSEVYLVDVA